VNAARHASGASAGDATREGAPWRLIGVALLGAAALAASTAVGALASNRHAGSGLAALRAREAQIAAELGVDPHAIERGRVVYAANCSSCHGAGGEGLEGSGKPLVTSTFVAQQSLPELVTFIESGRSLSDPANTTGIVMRPRGGNPMLAQGELRDVATFVAFLGRGVQVR
jgi:mono/diheme cytochrome c family protein